MHILAPRPRTDPRLRRGSLGGLHPVPCTLHPPLTSAPSLPTSAAEEGRTLMPAACCLRPRPLLPAHCWLACWLGRRRLL